MTELDNDDSEFAARKELCPATGNVPDRCAGCTGTAPWATVTSTVFEESLRAAIEEEEERRHVFAKLPSPVLVSNASRKWRRAVEDEDGQEDFWSPGSINDLVTARERYVREVREALVRQIRTKDKERGEMDLISIMATRTVLSFSTSLANAPWAPEAMSVREVEKPYFSPPPSSPVKSVRELSFFDTKSAVLIQTLPFLCVVVTSLAALSSVRGISLLVLGLSFASVFVSNSTALIALLTDVYFFLYFFFI